MLNPPGSDDISDGLDDFMAAMAEVKPRPAVGIPGLPDDPFDIVAALWSIHDRMPRIRPELRDEMEGPWYD